MRKIIISIILIVTILTIGVIGLSKEIRKKAIENRCWNMPLNDFYKDKECMKLMEEEYE